MKKTFSIIYCLLCFVLSNAQSSIILKDYESRTPIEAADVTINSLKDSMITLNTLMSDIHGKIEVSYKEDVQVFIAKVGYENHRSILKSNSSDTVYLKKIPFDLGQFVVTGNFTRTPKKKSVYDIQLIKKHQFIEKGITDLRGLLNQELNMSTNNGHANETALTFNGLSGNYVKILIDGVPLEGRLRGNIDLSQINLENVERIEILEGSVAIEYGTNAIAGAINIITKNNQINKNNFGVKTYYESIGQYNIASNAGFKSKNNYVNLYLGRNFFNGYSNTDTSREKLWKPREQYYAGLTFSKKLNNFNVQYGLDYFNELQSSRGAPRAPYFINAFDTYNKTDRFNNRLIIHGFIQKKHQIDLTVSHSYFNRKRNIYFKDLVTLDQILSPSTSDQDTTIFNNFLSRVVYHKKNKEKKINYLIGSSFKNDVANSGRIKDTKQTIQDLSFFANLQYKIKKKLLLQPALRLGYNSKYNYPILPSINVKYSPLKNLNIRSSYSKGYRSPSIKELFLKFNFNPTINLYGNENLIPENSHHFILSTSYYFKIKDNPTKIKTKLFFNQINDMIELVQFNNTDWKYQNIGSVDIFGVELKTLYKLKQTNLIVKYQLLGRKNTLANTNYIDKFHLSNQLNFSANYFVTKIKTRLRLNYKFIGSRTGIFENDQNQIVQSSLGQYQIFNISAHKSLWKNKLLLTSGIKNILNITQIDLKGDMFGLSAGNDASKLDIMWGRSFFISLNLRW